VSQTSLNIQGKTLVFSAGVEAGTGLALMIDPALVTMLLLGVEVRSAGMLLGRCFGIALLGLGLACWPRRQHADSSPPAVRAMLTYNALIALYLAYLGAVGNLWGVLLWPGVVLHAAIAMLLVLTWHEGLRSKTTSN